MVKRTDKSMIFGLFLTLLGLSILCKIFFKVDLPVFRVAFAIFLIYWGAKMLLGTFSGERGFSVKSHDSVVFSDTQFKFSGDEESNHYSSVFGNATVDLTQAQPKDKDLHVHVNTVFGNMTVLLDEKTPVRIKANSVFGEAGFPDGNKVAFGTMGYQSPAVAGARAVLRIKGDCVFGSLKFRVKGKPLAAEDEKD